MTGRYAAAIAWLAGPARTEPDDERRLLAGAYFSSEYSLESVALFNPSMVLHPDQNGVPRGAARFVLSLRACGEGHISSIEFRTGLVDLVDGEPRITLDTPPRFATTPRPVDDALYEVLHYGTVLNANRTYYLSRSQPPLLSEMVLEVFQRTGDERWLASAMPALRRFYGTWVSPPHLIDGVGLSRYGDSAEGPALEVLSSERDARGMSHYDRVRAFFRAKGVGVTTAGLFGVCEEFLSHDRPMPLEPFPLALKAGDLMAGEQY